MTNQQDTTDLINGIALTLHTVRGDWDSWAHHAKRLSHDEMVGVIARMSVLAAQTELFNDDGDQATTDARLQALLHGLAELDGGQS